jgi:hypothetical protein
MLNWLLGSKIRKIVENDILDARVMLSTMKLKLHKEGAEATVAYGEGVGAVAGLLAKRFGISVPDALAARGLDWRQLDDASRDLSSASGGIRSLLKSEVQSARTLAHNHTFGCLVLYHLYRLRFLSGQAAEDQKAEVRALADRIAEFARTMAEIAVGSRAPKQTLFGSQTNNFIGSCALLCYTAQWIFSRPNNSARWAIRSI